jgi:transcriptional regulator with XRE-family HTH domain
MSNLRKLVGERIRELRKNKNLSQAELAEKVGVDSTSICKLENGSHFPKEENLEKIAKALDVEIEDLFVFKHQRNKKTLISDINNMLDNTDEKNVKLIYKIILAVLK